MNKELNWWGENLEEEVSRYLDSIVEWGQCEDEDDPDYLMSKSDLMEFAYHFANWQKEQILKKAIEVTIKNTIGNNAILNVFLVDVNEGDKIKLIMAREDK
jgi:hypothetical protein